MTRCVVEYNALKPLREQGEENGSPPAKRN